MVYYGIVSWVQSAPIKIMVGPNIYELIALVKPNDVRQHKPRHCCTLGEQMPLKLNGSNKHG